MKSLLQPFIDIFLLPAWLLSFVVIIPAVYILGAQGRVHSTKDIEDVIEVYEKAAPIVALVIWGLFALLLAT